MDLIKLTDEALDRYFTRLSLFGYMNYDNVELLLILTYILELILSNDLDCQQWAIINKALSCIQGNCMIPYSACNKGCSIKQ